MIKVAFYIVFLPFILIAMVAYGLLYVALPVLVVAMIIGLLVKEDKYYESAQHIKSYTFNVGRYYYVSKFYSI